MSTDTGKRKVEDTEIIQIFKEADDPFLTAKEVSEQLPISRQQVNKRLGVLENKGFLRRKQCGSGQGWWIPS